jgi:hypothetical protein
MPETNRKLGQVISRAEVSSSSYNEAENTVRVTFATEAKVLIRSWDGDYYQVLVCDESAIVSDRLNNGSVHLVDSHNSLSSVKNGYGNVIRWGIDNKQCWADIKLTRRDDAKGVIQDIKDGVLRSVSIYAIPHSAIQLPLVNAETVPTINITRWEPREISLTLLPADGDSVIRSDKEQHTIEIQNSHNIKRSAMPETKPVQEQPTPQSPAAEIMRSCTTAGLDLTFATELVQRNLTIEDANKEIAAEVKRKATPAPPVVESPSAAILRSCIAASMTMEFAEGLIKRNLNPDQANTEIINEIARAAKASGTDIKNNAPSVQKEANESEIRRTAMQDAIIHRSSPGTVELNINSRDYAGLSLVDIARNCLHLSGDKRAYNYGKVEVIKRAIATTDYPDLLTSTVSRQLRKFFDVAPSNWKPLAQRTTVTDFRKKTGIQVDSKVTFDKIAEGGEYKAAYLQTSKATIAVDTYGKLIKITRQALINDDLDIFSRIPQMHANGALRLQADMVWGMITAPAKTPDGVNLFHASHANLAGSGGAIDETTLNAGIVAMALQKSPAGEILNMTPEYLLVPIEKQLQAEKIIANVIAAKTGDVNTMANRFKIISDARLSVNSATAWYLFANPSQVEGLMYAYMDGEEGLYTESRTNFEDDTIETKARMEFGVAAWDYRGAYKNPGA